MARRRRAQGPQLHGSVRLRGPDRRAGLSHCGRAADAAGALRRPGPHRQCGRLTLTLGVTAAGSSGSGGPAGRLPLEPDVQQGGHPADAPESWSPGGDRGARLRGAGAGGSASVTPPALSAGGTPPARRPRPAPCSSCPSPLPPPSLAALGWVAGSPPRPPPPPARAGGRRPPPPAPPLRLPAAGPRPGPPPPSRRARPRCTAPTERAC